MKRYSVIMMVISIVLGIVIGTVVALCSPTGRVIFSSPSPKKMDYGYLKNFAISLAKGEKPLDESIIATYTFKDGWFVVSLDQAVGELKAAYSLKASFPISEESIELEDGSIRRNFSVRYDEGNYSYTNSIEKVHFIISCLLIGVIITLEMYLLLDIIIIFVKRYFTRRRHDPQKAKGN